MKKDEKAPGGEVVFYKTSAGKLQLNVRLEQDTVWLTQDQMGQLFGRERSVITKHLRNVFKERELTEKAVCAKYAQVRKEGGRTVSRNIDYYT